jgi:Ca-activated chloride channel family protein
MTRVPLTRDHAALLQSLTAIRGAELGVGTAIGDALAASANRLRRAPEKSKVVVLMSDGVNNSGAVAPIDAARAARALGIRVYTIGVGTDTAGRRQAAEGGERVRYVLRQARIDEGTMGDIARTTGGRYFRARDTEALGRIYREIDRMERTPVETRLYVRHRDWYLPFLLAGAVLLILEWLFRATRWGRVP